jgi:hypothetical protein
MSATMNVDGVSVVMSQVAAVSCIQLPTLLATVAIQRVRNTGRASGAQAARRAAGPAPPPGGTVGVSGEGAVIGGE